MFPALAKVTWYDDVDGTYRKSVHILQCYNFTDGMKQIEDYYKNSLVKVHLKLYEEGLIEFPVDMYDKLDKWLEGEIH